MPAVTDRGPVLWVDPAPVREAYCAACGARVGYWAEIARVIEEIDGVYDVICWGCEPEDPETAEVFAHLAAELGGGPVAELVES